MDAKVAGATSAGGRPRSDQDRRKNCTAANPVDISDASDQDEKQYGIAESTTVSGYSALDLPVATPREE